MNESERMSTQAEAPAKLAQAKQTITKNDDAKFVSIVGDTWTENDLSRQQASDPHLAFALKALSSLSFRLVLGKF